VNPIVDPVSAALSGLVLFFVPGLAFLALTRRSSRTPELRADEATFLAVGISVMVSAWVALVLAEAGAFSIKTAAAVELAGALAALALGRRRLAAPIPRRQRLVHWAPAAILLAVALTLHARPTEYVFGGRDPGAYVAAMALIGRTGGLVVTDELVRSIPPEAVPLFFRHPENPARFMAFPLEIGTGRVVPEFFHLFMAFGAYLFQSMGTKGALATPPVFGILGTLAVFFALRRVFSESVALVATLLLAINVLQVWFARYPVSEPMSQFLLFLGLLAFVCWEDTGSPAYGALAGAAMGLSLLVRIDSLLLVAPLLAYFLLRRARRDLSWFPAAPFLIAFGLLALHGAVHSAIWSRKYALAIAKRDYWNQPLWVWIAAPALVVAGALLFERIGPDVLRRISARPARLRAGLSCALVLAAAYAYFLRPQLSAWAAADGNENKEAVALFHRLDVDDDDELSAPELAVSSLAPRDIAAMDGNGNGVILRNEWKNGPPRWPWLRGFRHLAAHDAQALVRFGWFAAPLGILLGLLGLLLTFREWRPQYLFFTLLCLTFTCFYFYKMRVTNDYYFAMRRVIPVILPGVLAWAAFLIVHGVRRGGAARVAAIALGTGLGVQYAVQTRPLLAHKEWQGAVAIVNELARRFGPRDIVLFEQPQSLHWLSLPLWAHHGLNVLEFARYNPDPDTLSRLIQTWRDRDPQVNVYFVSSYRSDPYLCSLFLQHVQALTPGASEWERPLDRPPVRAQWHSMQFRISRVVPPQDLAVPPLPEVDIGGSDDFQVSGFFIKEGGADQTFRWTSSCASIYVPAARGGRQILIRASAGRRPAPGDIPNTDGSGNFVRMHPAEVEVSLSGVALGRFVAGSEWGEHRFALPAELPPGPPVLRLSVKAWRPFNVIRGSDDIRDLGVMVDRVRIEPVG
jgi:hypothetical protein